MSRFTEAHVAAHTARLAGKKHHGPLEHDVLAEILNALTFCPCVGWFVRQNTGGMHVDGRYVAFAFTGCSDIIGQLRDGRFLAIEVKRAGKNPTEEQQAFLVRVAANKGVSFVARTAEDVFNHLRRDTTKGTTMT